MKKTTGEKKHVRQATGDRPERAVVVAIPPAGLATAAALSSGVSSELAVRNVIPHTWEDRARKAVEYYQEEPLVANAINAWRTFALGDEITVTCDNEDLCPESQDALTENSRNTSAGPLMRPSSGGTATQRSESPTSSAPWNLRPTTWPNRSGGSRRRLHSSPGRRCDWPS